MKERQPVPENLLPRIAGGDADAVRACLDRYGPLVWSLAKKLSRDAGALEDVVQEIFIDLWKHAERFDAEQGSETTFIAIIARRRIIDRQRKAGRTPKLEALEESSVSARDPGYFEVERGDEARLANEAMAQIRPEQRRLILMSVVDGLTHQEIATTTGLPLGTIKSHIRRGLSLAAEALRRAGKGGMS